jgi:hypothetical protein
MGTEIRGGKIQANKVSVTDSGSYYTSTDVEGALQEIGSGAVGGASTFLDLTDTPDSYASQALKFVRVKSDATGLEFATGAEVLSHSDLDDMPDIGGTNSDHDARYYTESETDSLINAKENPLTFNSPLSRAVNTISIPIATTSVNGYLSSTDWNTFNGKESALTFNHPLSRATNTISLSLDSNDLGEDGSHQLYVKDAGIDHGSIGGLTDDDHTQYLLNNADDNDSGTITFLADNIGVKFGAGTDAFIYWNGTGLFVDPTYAGTDTYEHCGPTVSSFTNPVVGVDRFAATHIQTSATSNTRAGLFVSDLKFTDASTKDHYGANIFVHPDTGQAGSGGDISGLVIANRCEVRNRKSSTEGNLTGTCAGLAGAYTNQTGGSCSTTTAIGVLALANATLTGTITNSYNFYGTAHTKSSGTCTNAYGLYLEAQTIGGTINNELFIASDGGIWFRDQEIYINSNDEGHLDLNADISIDLNTAANTDLVLNFTGTTNSGVLTWMEDEDYFQFSDDLLMSSTEKIQFNATTESISSANAGYLDLAAATGVRTNNYVRHTSANYRRYYHLPLGAFNPGASGASWVAASANTVGGWNLTSATHTLQFGTDIHSDWDGASDIKLEIYMCPGVAGSAGDTIDLKLVAYYAGTGDTATKTQTVEVATTTDGTQYKVYKVTFTLDWDAGGNVIEAGDKIGFILNLETDTSEIDNVIILQGGNSVYYNTTHLGIESGDT